jgi:ATP-dependent exoDNAse (exonuclease V) beta subunit
MALTDGADSVEDVIGNINDLFSDKSEGACIMLSSTHKSKGLERDRVWLLSGTYRPGTSSEESNLLYVAQTRAKHSLFLVSGFEKKRRNGESEES